MQKQSPRYTRLALALHIAIVVPTTVHAQQLIVNDGSTQTASGTYDTGTAPATSNGFALAASNQSTITGTGVSAKTGGAGAHALFADQGSLIELWDSSATATGSDAYGVLSDASASVRLTRTQVSSSNAINGHGVVATGGGKVEMTGGSVSTQRGTGLGSTGSGSQIMANGTSITVSSAAPGSHGATAQQGGVIRLGEGTSVEVTSSSANGGNHGLHASGAGSQVHASGATISTAVNNTVTRHNYGAIAQDGGLIDLGNNTRITTNQSQGFGLVATGSGSIVQGSGATVTTTGFESDAIAVDAGGKVALSNISLLTTGSSSRGALSEAQAAASN
mgnify:FL=1